VRCVVDVQERIVREALADARVLLGTSGVARADVFAFKDLDGFERCMQLDHLVEKVNTDNGSQPGC